MTDLSLFLLKNSLGAKMKKGLRSFCNGVGSTSTLNQRKSMVTVTPSPLSSSYNINIIGSRESPPATLEEMILQLEMEEKGARRAKMEEYGRRRMSCVDNSDILRSARNALNQYPRFSLDGRDAMYRSSFSNLPPAVCCKDQGLPPTLAGESVMWCKPGVVAKLMGLEVMPVPIITSRKKSPTPTPRTRRADQRHDEMDQKKKRSSSGLFMSINDSRGLGRGTRPRGSCSSTGYCVMKSPISVDPAKGRAGWPIGHHL